jgi:acetoin utilization deacetylase AcuC-like enzyme
MVKCFYHPGYEYPLPAEHPFPMDKFRRAHDLLVKSGAAVDVVGVEPIPRTALRRVHEAGYLEAVERAALDGEAQRRLGLPLRAGELLQRSRLEVAGTLAALRAALEDGVACNLAGGTHHAYPDCGMGYCVLNDVAVAVRELRQSCPGLRVLVVDTDAHQGNGTAFIFRGDPAVFTYSIHVGANYPSRKEASTLDVPLPRFVEGAVYLRELKRTLAPVVAEHRFDLAVWIAGADPHEDDRFGQMKLSAAEMAWRDAWVVACLGGRGLPLGVLFGGGYNRTPGFTAELHARTVRAVVEWWGGGKKRQGLG